MKNKSESTNWLSALESKRVRHSRDIGIFMMILATAFLFLLADAMYFEVLVFPELEGEKRDNLVSGLVFFVVGTFLSGLANLRDLR